MGLKFSKIERGSIESAALECLKKSQCCEHTSAFIFEWIFITLAGLKDNYKSFNEFDFRQHLTTNFSTN